MIMKVDKLIFRGFDILIFFWNVCYSKENVVLSIPPPFKFLQQLGLIAGFSGITEDL